MEHWGFEMNWYDYQAERQRERNVFNDNQLWIKTEIECPNCGEFIYKNMSLVLTSYPPQYSYKCPKCKWQQTGY